LAGGGSIRGIAEIFIDQPSQQLALHRVER
jgi:hypothetical protein